MKGFIANIEQQSLENTDFRRVLYTGKHSQLVLMRLKPNEEIGEEVHHLDQFIRCEAGDGKAILDGAEHALSDGYAVLVPAGAKHNIINTSSTADLKLYTLYAPAEHKDGTVHHTKVDALAHEEHFDGVTTE
jgi:mannose-6-phosphate isomerase-like protein (cupin superfamily)